MDDTGKYRLDTEGLAELYWGVVSVFAKTMGDNSPNKWDETKDSLKEKLYVISNMIFDGDINLLDFEKAFLSSGAKMDVIAPSLAAFIACRKFISTLEKYADGKVV